MELKPQLNTNINQSVLPEDYSTISLMHYSQLLNFLGPLGLIIPIILWSSKKMEIKDMDVHGKQVINYQLTLLLYTLIFGFLFFISFILTFILIGFVFILILIIISIPLMLLTIIPPILGGIAASKGKLYKYPMSISFIK